MTNPETYSSIWEAIADTPEQAVDLRTRSHLMRQIAAFINNQHWTQPDAAQHCKLTQARINDLPRGRLSRFSLDALVRISTALGLNAA